MKTMEHQSRRPPADERWIEGMRTKPVRISLRTRWLYTEPDPRASRPPGRTRWPFSRSGSVTRSDVPSPYEHMQDVVSHLHRAIAAFGDDKDLVIEVRLAQDRDDTKDEDT